MLNHINKRRSFTLVETMVASSIAIYIFLCAWAMYMIAWTWWYEISPQIECQRIARLAISTVSEGAIDVTLGTDAWCSVTHNQRRNGFKWASRVDGGDVTPTIAVIGTDGKGRRINFKLENDPLGSNVRSFYLGQDAQGVNVVYYQYMSNTSTPQIIKGTRGITDLTFEKADLVLPFYKVTATAEKVVRGVKRSAAYTDYILLRNV